MSQKQTLAFIADHYLQLDLFAGLSPSPEPVDTAALEDALLEAFEAGARSVAFVATPEMLVQLDWLAQHDPNGLWSEYLEAFAEASHAHGRIDATDLAAVIADMQE